MWCRSQPEERLSPESVTPRRYGVPMNAIHALADHTSTNSKATNNKPADDFSGSLALLAEGGFQFEIVDRCPAACQFCDGAIVRAA